MTPLHPALAAWLAQVNAVQAQRLAAGQHTTPISAREALAGLIAAMVPPGPALPWVHEAMVAGDYPVPVRAYHPAPDTPLPLLVYGHAAGGGVGGIPAGTRMPVPGSAARRVHGAARCAANLAGARRPAGR